MNAQAKTLLAASALAASGWVQAQITADITLSESKPRSSAFGATLTMPHGSGSFAFSDDLIGALAVAGIQTSIIPPAAGTVNDTDIRITAPVRSVYGILAAEYVSGTPQFTTTRIGTQGGITLEAPKANFATIGGALTVSGIWVDLSTQGIFAHVSGANGLVSQNVRLWDFNGVEGSIGLVLSSPPYHWPELQPSGSLTITGLKITDQAFDLFAQGLGLKAGGIAAMASIADYGVMTVAIPEPSTYLMMGLGLVGLLQATGRARTTRVT